MMTIEFVKVADISEGGVINRCEITGLDLTTNRFYRKPSAGYVSSFPTDKVVILFQDGPPQVLGRNGVFMEELLESCAMRLDAFQAGPFPHARNERAAKLIREAIEELNNRSSEVGE